MDLRKREAVALAKFHKPKFNDVIAEINAFVTLSLIRI